MMNTGTSSGKGKGKGSKSSEPATGAMKHMEKKKLLDETMHTNLNTVDSILMASAVMINLGALLYDSGEQSQGEDGAERTLITTIIVLVLVGSLSYCFAAVSIAVLAEMSPGTCKKPKAAAARQAAMKDASARRSGGGGSSGIASGTQPGSGDKDEEEGSSVMMANPLRGQPQRRRSNSNASDGTEADADAGVGINAVIAARRRKELAEKKRERLHQLDDMELKAAMLPGQAPSHRVFSQFSTHYEAMQQEATRVQSELRQVKRKRDLDVPVLGAAAALSVDGTGSVSPSSGTGSPGGRRKRFGFEDR